MRALLYLILFLSCFSAKAERRPLFKNDSNKVKKITLITGSAAFATGSLIYLDQAWYLFYKTGKFHMFNDNAEWLQMDKCGHAFSNYQSSRLMMEAFQWAGYNRKQQIWIGGTMGYAYMTAIELMDGYSEGWGFSWGDMVANTLGTSMAMGQEALWKEQRIGLKFSYAESGLAAYNPRLLGEHWYTRPLKDYNGQTYWLSVNPSSFMKKDSKFPKWLNLALGYSAYGMLGARSNDFLITDENGNVLHYDRERRVLLSLDIDLTRIKTKSKFLKGMFSAFNLIKIPAPALQWSKKGMRAYGIYF